MGHSEIVQGYSRAFHCMCTITSCVKSSLLFCACTHTDILVLHSLLFHTRRQQGWQRTYKMPESFCRLVLLKHWCPSLIPPTTTNNIQTRLLLPAKVLTLAQNWRQSVPRSRLQSDPSHRAYTEVLTSTSVALGQTSAYAAFQTARKSEFPSSNS